MEKHEINNINKRVVDESRDIPVVDMIPLVIEEFDVLWIIQNIGCGAFLIEKRRWKKTLIDYVYKDQLL